MFDDGRAILDDIIKNKRLRPRAVAGFWPANSIGEDVEIYRDEDRADTIARFHFLRQQRHKREDQVCRSLADFVAPRDSGRIDYIGGFVVSAVSGSKENVTEYICDQHNSYKNINYFEIKIYKRYG